MSATVFDSIDRLKSSLKRLRVSLLLSVFYDVFTIEHAVRLYKDAHQVFSSSSNLAEGLSKKKNSIN